MTVPVPKEFEERAKKERRSVSNLALIAFEQYLDRATAFASTTPIVTRKTK